MRWVVIFVLAHKMRICRFNNYKDIAWLSCVQPELPLPSIIKLCLSSRLCVFLSSRRSTEGAELSTQSAARSAPQWHEVKFLKLALSGFLWTFVGTSLSRIWQICQIYGTHKLELTLGKPFWLVGHLGLLNLRVSKYNNDDRLLE